MHEKIEEGPVTAVLLTALRKKLAGRTPRASLMRVLRLRVNADRLATEFFMEHDALRLACRELELRKRTGRPLGALSRVVGRLEMILQWVGQ